MKARKVKFSAQIEGDDGEPMDVEVVAEVSGKYIPARLYPNDLAHPEEWPEVDIISVTDENGVDWEPELTKTQVEYLEGKALEEEPDDPRI